MDFKKKAYVISEPLQIGRWQFSVTADKDVLALVGRLPFISAYYQGLGDEMIYFIDKRYEVEEVLSATVEAINTFLANKVEFNPEFLK